MVTQVELVTAWLSGSVRSLDEGGVDGGLWKESGRGKVE